jgi:DNA-binding CsgD family transcriptional regulator
MAPLKTIRFSALGWGFLTAWGIEGMLMSTNADEGTFIFVGTIASVSNIVAFLLVALAVGLNHRRQGKLFALGSRWPVVFAAALMFCGSLISLLVQTFIPSLPMLKLISLAFASFGYVLLTVLWGRYYASRDIQEIEAYAIWSTFLCALLYLWSLVTLTVVSMILWLCLPLATCACLLRCERTPAQPGANGNRRSNIPRHKGKGSLLSYRWFGLSILAASISVSLPPSLGELTTLPHGLLGFTMLSGLILAVILVIYYTLFTRRINFATFYRLLVPLTVGGLFLITLLPPALPFAGFGLVFAAQWGLYLLLWIYLAELCHRTSANPILVFVAGRLIFELGFLIAYLLGNLLPTLTTNYHVPFVFIAFGIAVFLILTTLMPIGDDETHRPSLKEQNGDLPSNDQEMMAELFQKQTQRLTQRYALSPRESEIVQYLVRGYSLPSIRNELFIAKSTIDSHTQRIYRKCGIHSRQELYALFNHIENQGTEPVP